MAEKKAVKKVVKKAEAKPQAPKVSTEALCALADELNVLFALEEKDRIDGHHKDAVDKIKEAITVCTDPQDKLSAVSAETIKALGLKGQDGQLIEWTGQVLPAPKEKVTAALEQEQEEKTVAPSKAAKPKKNGVVVAKKTEEKDTKKEKPIKKTTPSPKGKKEPSRKFLVYKAWKKGERDVAKLNELIGGGLSESTIKSWKGEWARGKNLPAGL